MARWASRRPTATPTGSCRGGLLRCESGDQGAGYDEAAGQRKCQGRLRIAGDHQEQGRENRRRIRRDTEETDVAALHADVPHIKGCAHRTETERQKGKPLYIRRGPDGRLEREM